MLNKINTVNVIEYADNTVQQVFSYVENREGNIEAEDMFAKLAIANGMAKTDIFDCLSDGIFENGNYQVFIVHSN